MRTSNRLKRFGAQLTTYWKKFRSRPLRQQVGFSLVLLILLITLPLFIFYQAVRFELMGELPNREELANINNAIASEVYAADGTLLGKYYVQERTFASYTDVSPAIREALIATEDARFFEHDGVDMRSIIRVAFKTLLLQEESSGGGSTLSQQLAKNLFGRKTRFKILGVGPIGLGKLSLPVNKVREMIVAQRLEDLYSKKDILTLYLNTVSFGDNAFGVETAAQRYFSKPASKITTEEAAVLVGMLKATYSYNPRIFPERSLLRRNVVLAQMHKYGYLNDAEKDSLQKLPLKIKYSKLDHHEGLATYFREHLRREMLDWCSRNTKPDGTPYNLYTDGLKIRTSIDADMQRMAEDAVRSHMKELQDTFFKHWKGRAPWAGNDRILLAAIRKSKRYKRMKAEGFSEEEIQEAFDKPIEMKLFGYDTVQVKSMSPLDSVKYYLYFLQAGMLSMDPQNGQVKAWVGGIDHEFFQYDHVNTRTRRQVGSTFKPIVYAAALEQGADPCTYIPAEQETYEIEGEEWSPGNSDGKYEGEYTFQGGLMNSVNTVSVKILKKTGLTNTIELAKAMGIENTIPKLPSIALGTPELSLSEMVAAYASFVNGGHRIKPVYLLQIEDRNGKVLEEFQDSGIGPRAMKRETAQLMAQMLRGVVDEGTASRLRWKYGLRQELAGKTGTTQSHADGWFIGMNPALVTGVWVGADNPGIRFRTTSLGQGANTALPIFALYQKKLLKDKELARIASTPFPPLPQALSHALACDPYRDPKDMNLFERIFGSNKKDQEEGVREERRPSERRSYPRPRPAQKKKKKSLFERIFGG